MNERRKVELRPAHAWDCPGCGKENFANAIRAELTPAERARMAEALGMVAGEGGDFLTCPPEVTCARCGAVFDSTDDRALPDDFDPHEAFGA